MGKTAEEDRAVAEQEEREREYWAQEIRYGHSREGVEFCGHGRPAAVCNDCIASDAMR